MLGWSIPGKAHCRAWLGTTLLLPPFGKAKGWVGEGLAFRGLI